MVLTLVAETAVFLGIFVGLPAFITVLYFATR